MKAVGGAGSGGKTRISVLDLLCTVRCLFDIQVEMLDIRVWSLRKSSGLEM